MRQKSCAVGMRNAILRNYLNLMKGVVKNDPTKDLIELMRSEMAQSGEQEMSILLALLQSNSNVECNSQMNPSSSMCRSS